MVNRRDFFCLVALAMVVILAHASLAHAAETMLSLETLIDIALMSNLGVKSDKAAVEQMDATVRQVQASQEWRVDGFVNTDYQKTSGAIKSLYAFADIEVDDAYSTTTGTLAISKPLFLSQNSLSTMSKSEKGKINAEQVLRQTKLQVMVDVVTSFYNVFRARDGVELTQSALRNAERSLQTAKEELSAGKGTPRAVSDAELELAKAKTALKIAKDSLFLAENHLSLVVGKSGLKVENLVCPSLSVERLPYTGVPWSWSLEKMQSIALERRPEYAQGAIGVEIANIELDEAKRAVKPSIGLDGSYLSNTNKLHTGFSIDSDYRFTGTISKIATSLPEVKEITISDSDWEKISELWDEYWEGEPPTWSPEKDQVERLLSGNLQPEDEWKIMLKAQFNIFDSYLTDYGVKSKESGVEKALNVKDQIEQGIRLDVIAKYLEVVQKFNSVQTADMALALARQRQEDTKVLIEVGMATSLTQDLADLGVSQAENTLRSALYDYEVAKAKLGAALGLDIDWIASGLALY
jgi:outer membrane protein TolC